MPEAGPSIVFFGGGSALRATSSRLVDLTHKTAHFLTPFDSGGSSAELRRCLAMPSVGDLRNRLVAMADRNLPGVAAACSLFSHRLRASGSPAELLEELHTLMDGHHPLEAGCTSSTLDWTLQTLGVFARQRTNTFDLQGASVGNLVLAGGYLAAGRDLDAVIHRFAEALGVRGRVRPVSRALAHLRAELADGRSISGQHLLTGKEVPALSCGIQGIDLVDQLPDGEAVRAEAHPEVASAVAAADLVCLPMGSFWTSLMASLLPTGVGRALAQARCSKVFVPSTGSDPELQDLDIAGCIRAIRRQVESDGGQGAQAVDTVLVDTKQGDYQGRLDPEELLALGVEVLDAALVERAGPSELAPASGEAAGRQLPAVRHPAEGLDPDRLAEALVSVAAPGQAAS